MKRTRRSTDTGAGDVESIGRPVWKPRFFETGDEERVVRMLTAAFGTWPRGEISVSPVEHLRWKLASHPSASGLCIVTEHESTVVGWQGYWLQAVKLDDQELLSRHSVDFSVHPEYQRMGIKMAMRTRSQVDNPRRNFALHFDPASGHPAFVHIRQKASPAVQAALAARRQMAQRVEARVLQVGKFAEADGGPVAWTVRSAAAFDERADALWEVASKQFRLMVVRRAAYLNWRYADARAGMYEIKVAEQDNELLGYVVSRMSHERGYLTDLLTLPGRPDLVRSLVTQSIAALRAKGASEVECWLPEHHPYWEAISHYPFDHKRRSIDYRVGPSNEYASLITVPFRHDPKAAVHITIGDSDVG